MTPNCSECIHSAMVDRTLMCGMFNVPCSPLTAQDCPDFVRCAGSDGEESEAHRVWYCEAE